VQERSRVCVSVYIRKSQQRQDAPRISTEKNNRYAGKGCSGRTDAQLHSVLHSSKDRSSDQMIDEGLTLEPIRLKSDHPSTALPRSARVHFGNAFVVEHKYPVIPIGLIHASSMETLHLQFIENALKPDKTSANDTKLEEMQSAKMNADVTLSDDTDIRTDMTAPAPVTLTVTNTKRDAEIDEDTDAEIDTKPVEIEVAKKMRQQISDVLGPRLELPKVHSKNQDAGQTIALKPKRFSLIRLTSSTFARLRSGK
jgi:hypothetical protein